MQPRISASSVGVCAVGAAALWIATAGIGAQQPPAKAPAKPPAAARSAEPKRQMIQVTVVRIKPDMLTEWIEFQKNETIPMLKKAGVKSRDAWTTGVFGETGLYAFVTPIDNFNQYDGDNPPTRALGADGARAYGEKNRRFVVSAHTTAEQLRSDLGYEMKMTGPPKLALLSSVQVASGKAPEFEGLIKSDVVPVMKKARVGYAVSQTVLGGDINEFTSLIFYDSFAEIGKGHPFDRILGAEGARALTAKAAAFVTHVERNIIRYVPDLSFAPRPTT
jgi:hypothetical protein